MHDDDDSALKLVSSRARRGLTPSAADAARVRLTLSQSVRGAPATPRPPVRSGWMGRVLVTAAFTMAGAGAGYWAGRRAEGRAPSSVLASRPVPRAAAPASPPVVPAPEPPAAVAVAPPAPRRTERTRHPSIAAPPVTPAESLAVEVRALRNVERALRDRNAGLAMAFLDDLDRAVPGGQMREERAALRAIARCASEAQPFGVNLAEEFSTAFPASAYHGRVAQACRGTDSSSPGD